MEALCGVGRPHGCAEGAWSRRLPASARASRPSLRLPQDDWQQMGISPLEVTQDAIIRAGKLRFFNTTFTPESAARFQAARKKP